MAKTNAIRAGRAFVELFADDSRLVRGLRAAEKRLKAFGANIRNLGLKIAGLGTAVLGPMLAASRMFASTGSQMSDMAQRTGVSVESLTSLGYVAERSGSSIDALGQALFRMNRRIANAATGSGPAVRALRDLGIEADSFSKLDAATQFKLLSDRINEVENPALAAQYAFEILGDGARGLLPMLKLGSEGMAALEEQSRRLGLTMSGEDARAASAFSDVLSDLGKVMRMGVFRVGAALAPMLRDLARRITGVAVTVSDWVNANRAIIVSIARIAAAVVAGGLTLVAFGTVIIGMGAAVGGLTTIITTVAAVFKTLTAVIGAMISPIGLVIGAIAALGTYIVYATEVGGKALIWLGERFNALKNDALASFHGIADALAAGDIALAVRVLWLTIRMEWTRGTNALEKAWLGFRDFFLRTGHDMFHGLLALTEQAWHGLEVGWIETTTFFARTWQNFVAFFAETWEHIKAGAMKAWNWIKSLFDDSIDLQAENRLVEEQKQSAIQRIDNDRQRQLAQREAKRQADRQRAEALHRATLAEIGRQNLEKHQQLDAEFNERIAQNEAELAAARREWQEAINTARARRQASATDADAPTGLETPDDILNRARSAVEGLSDRLGEEVARIGARGTFNAAALVGLQSGGPTERMASGIEKIERNTRPLRNAEALAFE